MWVFIIFFICVIGMVVEVMVSVMIGGFVGFILL